MSEPESPPPVPSDLYPYLNEIAERLFSGHAAVMIGSGFSRNAQPRAGSSPEFPDWSGLGDRVLQRNFTTSGPMPEQSTSMSQHWPTRWKPPSVGQLWIGS